MAFEKNKYSHYGFMILMLVLFLLATFAMLAALITTQKWTVDFVNGGAGSTFTLLVGIFGMLACLGIIVYMKMKWDELDSSELFIFGAYFVGALTLSICGWLVYAKMQKAVKSFNQNQLNSEILHNIENAKKITMTMTIIFGVILFLLGTWTYLKFKGSKGAAAKAKAKEDVEMEDSAAVKPAAAEPAAEPVQPAEEPAAEPESKKDI